MPSVSHLQRGDLSDGLVFDAVRIRLLEIGEDAPSNASARPVAAVKFPNKELSRLTLKSRANLLARCKHCLESLP